MQKVIVTHATTRDRAEKILHGGFQPTKRTASWLGFGVYFFYRGEEHTRAWARMVAERREKAPAIITAEVDLAGYMNLLDGEHWDGLRNAYANVPDNLEQVGPGYHYDPDFDQHDKVGWNYRDCEAVNIYVEAIEEELGVTVNSIMAAFAEGRPIVEHSWLFDQSSVMVCVRNLACISILDVEYP